MTITPEALDELVERLRAMAEACDLRAHDIAEHYDDIDDWSGKTIRLQMRADFLRQSADAIAALRKERDEARLPAPPGLPTIIPHAERERRIAEEVHATARDLERERCAMLAEMAGQMELAAKIRSET